MNDPARDEGQGNDALQTNYRVLVLLFGSLEFDGRARRVVQILKKYGSVHLLDVKVAHQGAKPMNEPESRSTHTLVFPPSASPGVRHISFWRAAVRLAKSIRPHVIVAEDYFAVFPSWLAARTVNARLVYDAHELIIPSDDTTLGARAAFWYHLEKLCVKKADLVIAANDQRAGLMQEHYRLRCRPTFLRNIPDLSSQGHLRDDAAPIPSALHRETGLEKILIYQGDMRLARGLDRVVEAVRFLPPEYRLVLVGDGQDLDRLKELAASIGVEGRVHFLGKIQNESLPQVSAMADIGIVTYPYRGLNNIYCAPNKLFEYAQAGLPILATDQPPLREAVMRYEIGALIAERDDPLTVARRAIELVESRDKFGKRLAFFLEDNRWAAEVARVESQLGKVFLAVHTK